MTEQSEQHIQEALEEIASWWLDDAPLDGYAAAQDQHRADVEGFLKLLQTRRDRAWLEMVLTKYLEELQT